MIKMNVPCVWKHLMSMIIVFSRVLVDIRFAVSVGIE